MFASSSWSAASEGPAEEHETLSLPDPSPRHVGRERAVDALAFVVAVILGGLFLSPELHDNPDPLSTTEVVVDVTAGFSACCSLWWRRRWPVQVALLALALGAISTSATPAGLLALCSLAVHRTARTTVIVTALWLPSLVIFAAYSSTTEIVSVIVFVMPLALAASGWGMFIRARRQLLLSMRERALRAEAAQELHQERVRIAERTRIAREMHDVLAHRISLLALHAGGLEVRPDLPPEQVKETAALMRGTARQALEELRSVIGVLREDGDLEGAPSAPQPSLLDIRHLVAETRAAGTEIDFEMDVVDEGNVPAPLGRDAYRIVQEALTNIAKHAQGARAHVRVSGAPGEGLLVSVRNPKPVGINTTPRLPGAGAGLVGLQERVALSGGTLVLGPDRAGDFLVEADLTWRV